MWLKLWMKIVETKDVLRIKRFLLKNCLQPKRDQNVLALKAPSEAAQGKAYWQELEAIDMPTQLGTRPNP